MLRISLPRFYVLVFIFGSLSLEIPAKDLASEVDRYIDAQMRVGNFMGSILIARDGKVLLSKGYGMANVEWEIPNGPETKFRLGSVTKQFTAAAILQLQEKGKLSVEDPACRYLEGCPDAWKDVTIHHLLTHTSGIPSYTGLPDYGKKMMIPTTLAEMVDRFRDLPLEFQPGAQFKYNNSGYLLLGMIIEKVSGQSYESYLQRNIFEPLGMKDTGYDRSEPLLKRRAAGYSLDGAKIVNAPFLDMLQPFSAGALYSTVEDLFRWDQALYTEKLLTRQSLDQMFAPFKDDYAYGWMVRAQHKRASAGHGGGINGFSTMIVRFPEEKAFVVVLSNVDRARAGRIGSDLAAILFGEDYEFPKERQVAAVDPSIYDAYVGRYELAPNFVITITREGDRLMSQATGQPRVEIFPESETKFFLRVVEAQLTFVKDERGEVTGLILHQGGADRRAVRIP